MQIAKRTRLDNGPAQRDEDIDPDDEEQRTLFCANLSDQVTEELLYELFIQSGPVESVRMPKDKDGRPRQFGFVVFAHACTVPYAIELYAGVRLFHRDLVLRFRNQNPQHQTLGKRRRIDSNSLSGGDRSPPPPSTRPRYDAPHESKRRFSPDNNSLRMGGQGGSNNRNFSHMQPHSPNKKRQKGPDERNAFKANDLERLGSNFMVNNEVMKGDNRLFDDAIKNALSNDRVRGGSGNLNPFRGTQNIRYPDKNQGGRARRDRSRHRGQQKHR